MAEHLTMNTVIHAAIRRDVARFDAALAAFPDGSQQRAEELNRAWKNFAFQIHHHHDDEESIFWPAFRALGADEALVSDLDGEHERMQGALAVADSVMQEFRATPTAANAESVRAAIRALDAVLNEHFTHEERDLEPFAAGHRETPEMKQAQATVRKAHKGEAGTFAAWLLDGADDDAKARLRKEIPPPVLFVLSRIPGRHYNRDIAPVWR
jgi:hemerythrin-like domain-containing protein